jgi:LysR family transcriptional regulator (chromosome initiation inhibitor)
VEELAVAVNADSLATWFSAVLEVVATWPDVALRLRVEDQAHSSALLRSGSVIAAVTADPVAVQGCSVTPLTRMRYLPVCTPEVRERHRKGRGVDLATMPLVRFNDRDELQLDLLRARGIDEPVVVHEVPSAEAFVTAVVAGLGWGMVPVPHARPFLDGGQLVRVVRDHIDVQLHWQAWRLRTERLDRLTEAVAAAAGRGTVTRRF